MANPNINLISQKLLKGQEISPSDLAYIISRLTDLEDSSLAASDGWLNNGTTTLGSNTDIEIPTGGILSFNGTTSGTLQLGGTGLDRLSLIEVNSNDTVNIITPQMTIGDGDGHGLSIGNAGNTSLTVTGAGSPVLTYSTSPVTTVSSPSSVIYQAGVLTTTATVTTIYTLAIPLSTIVLIHGFIVARRTGGAAGAVDDGAGYEFKGVYKNVAGTTTLIGTATITAIGESQVGWDVTLVPSGANLLIRVTGALNNNISWLMPHLNIMSVNS